MVPVIVRANDRDLPIGLARDKDELFAEFGGAADAARKLYDPRGDQSLDELKQQAFADRRLVEPARHRADEMAHAGQSNLALSLRLRLGEAARDQHGHAARL